MSQNLSRGSDTLGLGALCRCYQVSIRPRLFRRGNIGTDEADKVPVVSIRPRLFRRGNAKVRTLWNILRLFQSAPAFSDGGTPLDGCLDMYLDVSIRPRLFRRGNQIDPVPRLPPALFQSAPAFSDGGTAASRHHLRISACFNPPPPFQTGEHVISAKICPITSQ